MGANRHQTPSAHHFRYHKEAHGRVGSQWPLEPAPPDRDDERGAQSLFLGNQGSTSIAKSVFRDCAIGLACATLVLVGILRTEAVAQEVATVVIPGIGTVDLSQLAPEVRARLRIPGQSYPVGEPQVGDLPPLPQPNADDLDSRPLIQSEMPPYRTPSYFSESISRDQAIQHMVDERSYPTGTIPDGAYQKAWEHIQEMPPAAEVSPYFDQPNSGTMPNPTPRSVAPQSSVIIHKWLAYLTNALLPSAAQAQGVPWTQIGPAPLARWDGLYWGGVINTITVDPNNSSKIFLGTPNGGLWNTTDGGATWTTTTDGQPSLTNSSIAVDPTNSSVVIAGTGDAFTLGHAAGTLRSTDGGNTWCQIGPTYGPSPLAVVEVVIDNSNSPIRLWAASSKGLWYSDDAENSGTACGSVTWHRVTSLDTVAGTPDSISHVFVSPWNMAPTSKLTVYTSLASGNSVKSGWYRSTNRGGTWTQINPPGLSGAAVGRSTIAATPNPPNIAGTDVLYSLIGTPTICSGNTIGRPRIYKAISSDSGTTWTLINATRTCASASDCCDNGDCQCSGGTCVPAPDCNFLGWRSVQVDPSDANLVAAGAEQLFRSVDGGASGFFQVGRSVLHDDHNGLTFASHNVLLDGSDGGIQRTNNFSAAVPAWTDLNGAGLANSEFYAGTVDNLNSGLSGGGTQDNGTLVGGNSLLWAFTNGGDTRKLLTDPTNSNVRYFTDLGGTFIGRTTDGGSDYSSVLGNASCAFPTPLTTLAMDPSNPAVLLAYSTSTHNVYRTTNANTPNPGDVCWLDMNASPSTFPSDLNDIVIAPNGGPTSNLAFAASSTGSVWKTADGSIWMQSTAGLPNAQLTSVAIDRNQPCSYQSCVLYVTASGFSGAGNVFSSSDAGQTWTNIAGTGMTGFPVLPANKIVVDPTNSNLVYVATDMGIYEGFYTGTNCNGTPWTWSTFTNGFPAAAMVTDLVSHPDSGILRAFTYGRSVWEVKAFAAPNPDIKVNSTNPTTDVFQGSVSVTSESSGAAFGVTWLDDRVGANNWHVYFRGYGYNSNGIPAAVGPEVQVDDSSSHIAQAPAASNIPSTNCARVAWSDNRLTSSGNIFTQDICGDGGAEFAGDVRVDQHALGSGLVATNPAITTQGYGSDFAVAWQADRGGGGGLHDIYARFFDAYGTPKQNQLLLNTSTFDATFPATIADLNSNVFVGWEEYDSSSSNGRIMVSKFDRDGNLITGLVQLDNGLGGTERHGLAFASEDGSQDIIATWWERKSDGSSPETVVRRRFSNALVARDNETQVDQPPAIPVGAQRAARVGIATDASDNFVVSWQANVNDSVSGTWNIFARSYNASNIGLKNDFKIDLAPRTAAARSPRVARGSQSGRFVYAWRDNRSGHYDVYARAVESLN